MGPASPFFANAGELTRPTEGTFLWEDVAIVKSPDAMRAVLGYLPQDFGVYPNLNAIEFLEYIAAIKGLDAKSARKRIDELLQVVNLVDAAERPFRRTHRLYLYSI
jgi:ABC-2 type transport system ATP-binding protein